jgi:hypothetical protein
MDDITRNSSLVKRLKKSVLKEGCLSLPEGYSIPAHQHTKSSFKTTRKTEYRGKSIKIETTYKITIDGEPFISHTTVMDDGSVHCHDFPNYSFPSAVDMAKKILDAKLNFNPPEDELSIDMQGEHGGHGK